MAAPTANQAVVVSGSCMNRIASGIANNTASAKYTCCIVLDISTHRDFVND